jgi:sugar phosphate isomerase/epimerase
MAEVSRRSVLTAGALAMLGANHAMAGEQGQPFFARTGLPIGVQLYTLADSLAADLEGTLAQIAAIGFKTVETAGYLGHTASQMRAAFDRASLICTSAHVPGRAMGPDACLDGDLSRVIDDAHTLGLSHVVMPMLYVPKRFEMKPRPGEDFADLLRRVGAQVTTDDWKFTADFLNAKGETLKQAGLQLAYHNHNLEFAPLAGSSGYEILLKGTDPNLVCFEMDAGWVAAAGHDPLVLLRQYPGRFRLMHVKDIKADTQANFALRQDPTEVGSGVIDWKAILPAAHEAGVTRFFVEQEPPFAAPPIGSVRKSFVYLKSLVA